MSLRLNIFPPPNSLSDRFFASASCQDRPAQVVDGGSYFAVGRHPLDGVACGGSLLVPLREAFHDLLFTTLCFMKW